MIVMDESYNFYCVKRVIKTINEFNNTPSLVRTQITLLIVRKMKSCMVM